MKNILWLALVALALGGCATMQSRREAFIRENPSLTAEQKQAIRDGTLVPGMTPAMVEMSWGRPDDVVREIIRGREVTSWIYVQGTDRYRKVYQVRYDVQGRLAEVRLLGSREQVYEPLPPRRFWLW